MLRNLKENMNIMRKIGDAEKNRMELLEVKDLK